MKPYGSKRSFDTEPRIKVPRALVKREGEALIEEQLSSEHGPVEGDGHPGDTADHARTGPPIDLTFTCSRCKRVLGDFFYVPSEDCCCECAGLEFPP